MTASNGKRPYSKPEMFEVKLVAEEALFSGCKTQDTGGPRSADGGDTQCRAQGTYGGWTNCSTLGS